jgi:pimeloyl-ACP methyl ester carboxylesterase
MAPTVEGAGVDLAYLERGAGPAVLLLHGMAATSADWVAVAEALAPRARVIAPDRRGYGSSGAPEPYARTTVEEQAEDVAALLRALDAVPALLCGVDLGALVCLDVLKRHASLAVGAVLVEPPLFAFVADAAEALADERAVLERALRDGGPPAAVDAWLARRGATPERGARARADAGAFFADYGAPAGWPVTRRELRAITAPIVVLAPLDAPAHVQGAARALAEIVPGARLAHEADPAPALAGLLD